jgi:hypothetical protein
LFSQAVTPTFIGAIKFFNDKYAYDSRYHVLLTVLPFSYGKKKEGRRGEGREE